MGTIFTNTKYSKPSNPRKLVFSLTDKDGKCCIIKSYHPSYMKKYLQNVSIYVKKARIEINRFKTISPNLEL